MGLEAAVAFTCAAILGGVLLLGAASELAVALDDRISRSSRAVAAAQGACAVLPLLLLISFGLVSFGSAAGLFFAGGAIIGIRRVGRGESCGCAGFDTSSRRAILFRNGSLATLSVVVVLTSVTEAARTDLPSVASAVLPAFFLWLALGVGGIAVHKVHAASPGERLTNGGR